MDWTYPSLPLVLPQGNLVLDLFHKSRGRLEVKVAVVQRSEEVEPQAVSLTTVAVFR